MSEQQQGPGWWLASDGRWYPPEQAPTVAAPGGWAAPNTAEQVVAPPAWGAPPPAPVPPKGGISTGAKVALIVGGIVGVLVLLAVAVTVLGEESTTAFKQTGDSIGGFDSTYSEPVVIPEGFAVVQGDGVSIAVPSDWTLLDANDMALTGDDISTVFPDAPADMLEQGVDMFARGAVLVAFDFTGDSFASNINVIDVPTEAPLGVLESQAEREFDALGVDVVDSSTVVLGIGEALRVEYTFDLPLPDGSSAPGAGVQYYVPLDGHTYIVTVSSGVQAASLADAMIDTFRAG